ncbi:ATPase, P-type (transporting), HAD superfamily, subfamily IC [Methanococcus aeolicus Nankai-3]|uniref:ATPase, P-type (Transporting), HAD superfamily, subfamily IC n=1 Tax=Methanococcus aeolicus (strain ATCC BAA-1280 / DSM 17508 / OCM 812 / Nankai-3) TaxID=419665 RepID=A6UVF6_META3|nr:cation-translocating P-type ATPase [Methanococcus aeolicus]ABR56478.1 ATPase, P-type (transporting), HAD superfamily, subfamily IC [Methanococcus aeolicus Nankai-3]
MGYLGLTAQEAEERLKKYGYNELEVKKKITWFNILVRQFVSNFLVWVLIVAMAISAYIGEMLNFWMILFLIIFVIMMGFVQEYKAEKAMESLKKFIQYKTQVIRDGWACEIFSKEVVPGDILVLKMGDKIPADAKIITTSGEFKVDESILTGESNVVKKSKEDLIFAGTQVVHGACKSTVINTGMKTELGKIAEMVEKEEEKTPLQIKIHNLGKTLSFVALLACILIFSFGIFMGAPIYSMLMVALALAVAAVPEGLPLALTLTLSLGMHNMAKHNAVVRKMLAVETLGSVTVICTDKTGTLTKNEMTVEKIYVNGEFYDIGTIDSESKEYILKEGKKIEPDEEKNLILLLKAVSLCNNAQITSPISPETIETDMLGDPTEVALAVVGTKIGLWKHNLDAEYLKIHEIPFTSKRKLMTTVHRINDNESIVFTKGAPEVILNTCKFIEKNNEIEEIDGSTIEEILMTNSDLAGSSYRVIGVAYKKISNYDIDNLNDNIIEKDLTFLGLIGMIDPPKKGVYEAVKSCKKAGIEIIMITGDGEETAKAIGEKIGIYTKDEDENKINDSDIVKNIIKKGTIVGTELDSLSEDEFDIIVDAVSIYARVVPEQKLKIVKSLKKKGHIVAMTGDGVNDAPALKIADIGIAMGKKGTDVAKESSDMILQDDNFATIVEAIKIGRNIYENIEKFTCYLVSHNFMQVILIAIGIFIFGFDYLPLLPLHILFINAVGEELPAISLGMSPVRKEIMDKPPRKTQNILNKMNLYLVSSLAIFMTVVVFGVFIFSNPLENIEYARTMAFSVVVGMIIFNTFNFISLDKSIFKIDYPLNKMLIIAISFIAIITIGILNISYLKEIFKFASLNLKDWIICIIASFSTVIFMEFIKIHNKFKNSNK